MIYSFSKIYFSIISTAAFIICIHSLQKCTKIIVVDKTTQTQQNTIIDSSNNCFDDTDDVEIVKTLSLPCDNLIRHEFASENLIKYSLFNPNYWK